MTRRRASTRAVRKHLNNLTGAPAALMSIFYGAPFLANRIGLVWLIFEVGSHVRIKLGIK